MVFSERIEPVTQFIKHREFKLDVCYRFQPYLPDVFVYHNRELHKDAYRLHAATICALIAGTRCQHRWGGPEVNKFKQVSSDGHKMSLAGSG